MSKRTGIINEKQAHWMSNPVGPRLLPLKEAAQKLGLTTWSMRERIWAGDIPVVRFSNGRKMFVDTQDLEAFVQDNKHSF